MLRKLILMGVALTVFVIANDIGDNAELKRPERMMQTDNRVRADVKIWRNEMESATSPLSSDLNYKTPKYKAIISEGCKISHALFEMYIGGDMDVIYFFPELFKVKFSSTFDKDSKTYLFPDYPEYVYYPPGFHDDAQNKNRIHGIWEYWWKEGRKLTPRIFERKYKAYHEAIESKTAGKTYQQAFDALQDMGIIILPNLLEKIEEGDETLLPMFAYLSGQKNLKDVSECRKWWDANKGDFHDLLDY